jgi:hypothetical protein
MANELTAYYKEIKSDLSSYTGIPYNDIKITELRTDFTVEDTIQMYMIVYMTRDGKGHKISYRPYKVLGTSKEHKDFLTQCIDKSNLVKNYRDIINKKFKEINRPGIIFNFTFQNFYAPFEIHCDGFDAKNVLDKRPANWNDLSSKDYMLSIRKKAERTHQGLINLNTAGGTGTLIFDQLFEFSTYVNFNKDLYAPEGWSYGPGSHKEMITFAKGDKPNRFGYDIINYTGKPFSDEDYATAWKDIPKVTQPKDVAWDITFPKEEAFGLSLETILKFGDVGTLISWDARRYHKTRPYQPSFDNERLTMQYEAMIPK